MPDGLDDYADVRYQTLQDRYRTVVQERDQLRDERDDLRAKLVRFAGCELMAVVCDNKCGRSIVGATEEIVRAEARRLMWFTTPSVARVQRDYCPTCHQLLIQTPL